jgi:hypothetical protein
MKAFTLITLHSPGGIWMNDREGRWESHPEMSCLNDYTADTLAFLDDFGSKRAEKFEKVTLPKLKPRIWIQSIEEFPLLFYGMAFLLTLPSFPSIKRRRRVREVMCSCFPSVSCL